MGRIIQSACIALLLAGLLYPQQRYSTGASEEIRGFTINADRIRLLEEKYIVTAIRGKITFDDENGPPMEEALFEIRGPGDSQKIRSALTDDNGKFEIKNVPEGTYRFVVGKVGYTAYGGEIVLFKQVKKESKLHFSLHPI